MKGRDVMWKWLDGKKTVIGAVMQLSTLVLPAIGAPVQVLGWLSMAANAVLGLGVAHKVLKQTRKDGKAPAP